MFKSATNSLQIHNFQGFYGPSMQGVHHQLHVKQAPIDCVFCLCWPNLVTFITVTLLRCRFVHNPN